MHINNDKFHATEGGGGQACDRSIV